MPSKHNKSSRRDQYSKYPTGWTEWAWSDEHQRNYRARELSEGEWEYEYARPSTTGSTLESTPWTPRDRSVDPQGPLLSNTQEQSPQYQQSENYSVSGITEGLAAARIKHDGTEDTRYTQGKQTYPSADFSSSHAAASSQDSRTEYERSQQDTGQDLRSGYQASQVDASQGYQVPYGISQPSSHHDYPRYGSQHSTQTADYNNLGYGGAPSAGFQSSSEQPTLQSDRRFITKDDTKKKDKLDQRFRVQKSKEFYFGRVFKVLWSEPTGSGGTEITQQPALYGEKAFHKVRRFIVIRVDPGHSICIPILTYGYQGVLKRGVHPECHTVVYSSSKGPKLLEGEKGLLTKKPIKIDMKDPSEKLDPLSRLNYAKTYTVEHNVKVFFIGRVAENHEQEVVTCFNLANPPVQVPRSGGHHSGLLDNTLFEHAEGDETAYRDAVNIPTASPAWGNTGDTQTYGSPISTNMYSPPVSQPYGLSYSATPQMPPGPGQQNFPPQDYPPQDSYHQPTYDDGYDD